MNKKEWTSKLRNRMADYQEPVRDELWERIENALSEESGSPIETIKGEYHSTKARIVKWQRWAAAAIVLLVMSGGFYFYVRQGNRLMEVTPTQVVTTKTVREPFSQSDGSDDSNQIENTRVDEQPLLAKSMVSSFASPVNGKNMEMDIFVEKKEEVIYPEEVETEERYQDDNKIETVKPEERKIEDLREQQSVEKPNMVRNDGIERMRRQEEYSQSVSSASHRSLTSSTKKDWNQQKRHVTTMLYAQNSMTGDEIRRDPVMMNPAVAAKYEEAYMMSYNTSTRSKAPAYLYNYEEITKHHQPITIGLSVSYPLSSRLSLLSGITYTKLSSDFVQKMNNSKVVTEQQLYYVGVPLRISYRLLTWKGFSLYGIAGGTADMNVKANYTTEGMEQKGRKDRVLFSVDAAAGVQYQVFPQMGLYVEPGVKYYFDNKSRVENYFKEHPANFNLQVGIRFDLNR